MNSLVVKTCYINARMKSTKPDEKNCLAECCTCKKAISGNVTNSSNFIKHLKVGVVVGQCDFV